MNDPLVIARTMPLPDGALIQIMQQEKKIGDSIRLGPNEVHAFITHHPGCGHGAKVVEHEDLGISHNLLTNIGRDLLADNLGRAGFGVTGTVATGSSATSLTATGTPFTADDFNGWVVIAEESTNAPVFGNIGDSTTSVLTVDAWRTGDETAGTTPGTTANYLILPLGRAQYMGLTENAGAAAAGDVVLTGEITTGGASRARTTHAHTDGTATLTEVKAFSITASFPAIHKMALFTSSTLTSIGIPIFVSVLNADANVVNGDTLTVTDTVTLS